MSKLLRFTVYLGCDATRSDFNDEEKVKKGSFLNMTTPVVYQAYLDLAEAEGCFSREEIEAGVVIPSRNNDAETRKGIKGKPLTNKVETTRALSVLHCSLLNSFTWVMTWLIKLSSGCLQWGKGVIPQTTHKRVDKKTAEFEEKLGTLLGYRTGNFNNMVTGYFCKAFFSETKRVSVLEMVKSLKTWKNGKYVDFSEDELENIRIVLQNINVISKVVATSGIVDLLRYREFCIQAQLHIIRNWKWVLLGESIHRLYAHRKVISHKLCID